jgi:CDP-glucose 4,6-dehydratase
VEDLDVNSSFWTGKRVLVTGHTGFKGSWLTLWLRHLGADVIGYALDPPSTPNLFELASAGEGIISVHADVREWEPLLAVVHQHQPEIAFHLAAQSLVRRSYEDPRSTFDTNVMGTVNFLDVLRESKTRVAVVVTSDKCYDNVAMSRGYREGDLLGGRDPYSGSKACAEIVTSAYRSSFFTDGTPAIASVRAGNVIGGGDWADDRLIPDALRAFDRNEPLRVRNPDSERPWQHVLDPLHGYLMLAERLWHDGELFAEPWNFGPTDPPRSVAWLAEMFCRTWDDGASWSRVPSSGPSETAILRLDPSKAIERLSWRPKLGVETAVEWTVRWYKEQKRDPARGRELVHRDIAEFEALR